LVSYGNIIKILQLRPKVGIELGVGVQFYKKKNIPTYLLVPVFRIRIRIRIHRIHVFLGLPDPDPNPLVRGMDPDPDPALDMDPDPSIIKQI
jgi:hypothetical protein